MKKYLTDQDHVLYGGQETLFLVLLSDCCTNVISSECINILNVIFYFFLKFHSLAPMYYRGSAAAVIVYDITKLVRNLKTPNQNYLFSLCMCIFI